MKFVIPTFVLALSGLSAPAHADLDFTRVSCSRYTDQGLERVLEVRHSAPSSDLVADYFLANLPRPLTCTETLSGETPTALDCDGQTLDGASIKVEIVSADGILNYGRLIRAGDESHLICHPEITP